MQIDDKTITNVKVTKTIHVWNATVTHTLIKLDNLAKICQVCTQLNLLTLYSEAPSEPYQTSKKRRFAKYLTPKSYKLFPQKSSLLDVWQGSEYATA